MVPWIQGSMDLQQVATGHEEMEEGEEGEGEGGEGRHGGTGVGGDAPYILCT